MASYVHQYKQQFIFAYLIYQKQVSFDMTFPIWLQFAVQLMVPIFRRQFFALSERINGLRQIFFVLAF